MRIAIALLLLAGCGVPAPRRTVGISVLTLQNPFFKEIADTFAAEAKAKGYETLVVSGDFDVARQDKQLKDFIVKGVDAIVLSPCDSKAIAPAIREANAAGVPVFTVDIACLIPEARVVCHVATDNLSGGRQAGQAMIEALGAGGGRIAVLDHKPIESCQLRVKGFKEVVDAHNATPGRPRIEIVAELPGGGAKDQGFKAAEDLLQAHPNLAAIFAINDPSALGARAALEKAGRADRVKLVGFDGQPEGRKAIRDGKIYADPIQFPDQIGRRAAQAVAAYFAGDAVPAELLIPTGLYREADGLKEFPR
jgi:ribose transport system substrate-binding protein